jgi:hypothetical protein
MPNRNNGHEKSGQITGRLSVGADNHEPSALMMYQRDVIRSPVLMVKPPISRKEL